MLSENQTLIAQNVEKPFKNVYLKQGGRHSPECMYLYVLRMLEIQHYLTPMYVIIDRLCGLVVRVSGYRYRGPRFDPRRYQIF